MSQILPLTFATLCAAALLAALYALFRSLRAALTGEATELSRDALVTQSRATLLTEKTALLESLRDLENDHEAGKLSDEDRDHSNARLRTRAKAVLRALEEEIAPHRAKAEAMLDLPAEITPGRALDKPRTESKAPEKKPGPNADERASGKHETARVTCFACGTTNDEHAALCEKCGAAVNESRS